MDTTQHSTAGQDARPGPDDPRTAVATAVATLLPVVGRVAPDQLGMSTPCDGMDVAGLGEHLVMVVRRIACAGRGDDLSTWPADAADVAPADWAEAILAAAHDCQAAWTDDVLDRPTPVPWGVFSGAEVLAVYANELTVHTWDLATATGQQVDWNDGVLHASWAAIRRQLPTAGRTPMWDAMRSQLPDGVEWQDPFGDAVQVPEDAPLIDRLVAWNGRTP